MELILGGGCMAGVGSTRSGFSVWRSLQCLDVDQAPGVFSRKSRQLDSYHGVLRVGGPAESELRLSPSQPMMEIPSAVRKGMLGYLRGFALLCFQRYLRGSVSSCLCSSLRLQRAFACVPTLESLILPLFLITCLCLQGAFGHVSKL